MHFIYIDDSKDEKLCIFSALAIPVEEWRASFNLIKDYRHKLRLSDGVYVQKEFHAWKLVSGRGNIADRIVTKHRRSEIFRETLEVVTKLPGARLFNTVFPKTDEEQSFEWLLNRINVGMRKSNSYAILICDEGKEEIFTRMVRRMGVHNPIPSRYGQWEGIGTPTRNIPIDRIIEDPVFKQSDRSYFIQMVDLCAFALLRRERPTDAIKRYGLETAFNLLKPILVVEANRNDPEGIIRPRNTAVEIISSKSNRAT